MCFWYIVIISYSILHTTPKSLCRETRGQVVPVPARFERYVLNDQQSTLRMAGSCCPNGPVAGDSLWLW